MKQEGINEILEMHKKWLNNESNGVRANLRDADLRGANLRDANLCGAYLCGADLRDADLRSANLRDADLSCADLRSANLRDADLRSANLRDADLRSANLSCADLRSADLRSANLRDADLRDANLDFSCFPLWCGGLDVHIDDRQAKQLLYHLIRNVQHSNNVSDEVKKIICTPESIALANEFHRVNECGKITIEGKANE